MKSIFLIILSFTINTNIFCQQRPNNFYESYNIPRWTKLSGKNLLISKNGYNYSNSEFKVFNLPNSNDLLVNSITENFTFLCQNFQLVPENISLKIKEPTDIWTCHPNCSMFYYANSLGTYWIFDKGKAISGVLSVEGICSVNCGNIKNYFKYIGENGKVYRIKAGIKGTVSNTSFYIDFQMKN